MIPNMVTSASARRDRGLVVFGEFFFDLVFYDLPTVPRMGEEVKTASFGRFPGGGLATTALVAAGLGTPTKAITRVGRDALGSPEWQMLVESGISTEGSEFDPHFTNGDDSLRCLRRRSHDDYSRQNQCEIGKRKKKKKNSWRDRVVQKQLRSGWHLHLACALRPPQLWMAAIRKLRKRGLTISADLGWNPDVLESPRLPSLLKEFEFTFPNESEAKAMTGEKTIEVACKKIGTVGPSSHRETWSPWFLWPFATEKIVRVKSIRVRAVDATGSGDAFDGGFSSRFILPGGRFEECLRAGNICGAVATTGAGGSFANSDAEET